MHIYLRIDSVSYFRGKGMLMKLPDDIRIVAQNCTKP